jgi:RND family efflux transporter MFP subunit
MSREITKPIHTAFPTQRAFWDRSSRSALLATILFAGAVGVALATQPTTPAPSSQPTSQPTTSQPADPGFRAIARAREDLALAFTIPGRVASLLAKPGTAVKQGDPLLQLEASEAKAEVELLRLRAASTLEEEASKAEWDLAKLEEERWNTVHERGASTDMQLRKAQLETQRTRLAYELFVQRRQEAVLQLQQAQARLDAFTLRAPVDGIVDEVVIEAGEVIEPGKPVVRLVNVAVLRIDVAAPTQDTIPLRVGGKAIMTSTLTTPPTIAAGTIIHIASVGDASSATRLVRVEVPRPDALPAGIECFVRFE